MSDNWTAVRTELKEKFVRAGITTCELRWDGCTRGYFLGFAHSLRRRKIKAYKGEEYDRRMREVILACQPCHAKLDALAHEETEKTVRSIIERREMTLNDYHVKMLTFLNPEVKGNGEALLLNAVLGLTGESGEVADAIKKWAYHGHELDTEALVKEAGDILFYVALLSTALGVTLEDTAQLNVEKLSKRYPNGFTVEDSLTKKDENNQDTKTE